MNDKRRQLSIGAVSKATGVPVETLRTWERRYGVPSPGRSAMGELDSRLSATVCCRARPITVI